MKEVAGGRTERMILMMSLISFKDRNTHLITSSGWYRAHPERVVVPL